MQYTPMPSSSKKRLVCPAKVLLIFPLEGNLGAGCGIAKTIMIQIPCFDFSCSVAKLILTYSYAHSNRNKVIAIKVFSCYQHANTNSNGFEALSYKDKRVRCALDWFSSFTFRKILSFSFEVCKPRIERADYGLLVYRFIYFLCRLFMEYLPTYLLIPAPKKRLAYLL